MAGAQAAEQPFAQRVTDHAHNLVSGYDLSTPHNEARKRLKQWPDKRKQIAARFNESWSNYRHARKQAILLVNQPQTT